MAYLVRLTDRAELDLEEIYSRIEADSSALARSWFEGVVCTTYSLAKLPNRGKPVPKRPRLRRILYGRKPNVYWITCLVDNRRHVAEILHIHHAAKNEDTSAGNA